MVLPPRSLAPIRRALALVRRAIASDLLRKAPTPPVSARVVVRGKRGPLPGESREIANPCRSRSDPRGRRPLRSPPLALSEVRVMLVVEVGFIDGFKHGFE